MVACLPFACLPFACLFVCLVGWLVGFVCLFVCLFVCWFGLVWFGLVWFGLFVCFFICLLMPISLILVPSFHTGICTVFTSPRSCQPGGPTILGMYSAERANANASI